MIDTHAHIYSEEYENDRSEMLQRAWDAGITQIWMPNCDITTIMPMIKLTKEFPEKCLPMIGLHPCYVKADFENQLSVMEEWLSKESFIAVGEIGMDLYWDKTFRDQQEEAFLYQCKMAIQNSLWIDIHSRDAFWETAALIEKFGDSSLTGIFHCFTGTLQEANKAIELGFKLGIGGVSTFKNGGLDKVIPYIDLEHMVLETDCPYLAPVPFRGKRNEVAYTSHIAVRVADLKNMLVEDVIITTDNNAKNMLLR